MSKLDGMRAKKYLFFAVSVFILSLILTTPLWAIKFGFLRGFYVGIWFAVVFTVIFGIIIICIDYVATRDISDRDLALRQSDEINIFGQPELIFQKSVETLSSLKIIRSIRPYPEKMTIEASTKVSIFSFGEKVTLRTIPAKDGRTIIHIDSEPLIKSTRIDYGKNFRNIKSITKALQVDLM
jgi:hypothetical protein